ncbi:hypothetical protein EV1_003249 [Malus domestica]
MTCISRVVTLSILEVIRRIRRIQLMDHNGTLEDNPSIWRLLLVVQDHRGSLISQARGVMCKVVVGRLAEIVEDDNKLRDVFTT